MVENGICSIVRRGKTYKVAYTACTADEREREAYLCAEEEILRSWLRDVGIDAWAQARALAVLRQGGVAVLPVVLAEGRCQALFPYVVQNAASRVAAGYAHRVGA